MRKLAQMINYHLCLASLISAFRIWSCNLSVSLSVSSILTALADICLESSVNDRQKLEKVEWEAKYLSLMDPIHVMPLEACLFAGAAGQLKVAAMLPGFHVPGNKAMIILTSRPNLVHYHFQ